MKQNHPQSPEEAGTRHTLIHRLPGSFVVCLSIFTDLIHLWGGCAAHRRVCEQRNCRVQSERGRGSDTAGSEETEGPRGDAGGGNVASDPGLGGQRAGHRGMGERSHEGGPRGRAQQLHRRPHGQAGPEVLRLQGTRP